MLYALQRATLKSLEWAWNEQMRLPNAETTAYETYVCTYMYVPIIPNVRKYRRLVLSAIWPLKIKKQRKDHYTKVYV